jgi:hypothetical protein
MSALVSLLLTRRLPAAKDAKRYDRRIAFSVSQLVIGPTVHQHSGATASESEQIAHLHEDLLTHRKGPHDSHYTRSRPETKHRLPEIANVSAA